VLLQLQLCCSLPNQQVTRQAAVLLEFCSSVVRYVMLGEVVSPGFQCYDSRARHVHVGESGGCWTDPENRMHGMRFCQTGHGCSSLEKQAAL